MWRNWQTRGIQNPVGFTPGEGSTPSFGSFFVLNESRFIIKKGRTLDEALSIKLRVTTFIVIVMVIFLHAYNLQTNFAGGTQVIRADSATAFVENIISQGITRIAVPFFFIASGYLFYQNMNGSAADFRKKILKRCRTLVLPFLFWSASVFMAVYLAQMLPATKDFFANEPIRDYSLSRVLKTIFFFPIPHQLWFIRDLFVFVLLSPVIYYVLRAGGISIVFGLGVVWLLVTKSDWYSTRFEGFFFFVLGGFIALSKIGWRRMLLNPRWLILLWFGIVFIRSYFLTYNRDETLWLHRSGILVGLAAFWFNYDLYSSFFERSQIFRFTYLTFFVYAAHEPMLTIFRKLWARLLTVSEISALVGYFVCPLLVLLICIALGVFLKRYCKSLYKVMTGWR